MAKTTERYISDAEVKRMTDNAVNTPAPAKIDIGKKKGKWGEVYRHILTAKDRAEHKTGIPVEGWEPSNYEGPSRTYHDGRFTGKGKNRRPKSKPYTGKSNNT